LSVTAVVRPFAVKNDKVWPVETTSVPESPAIVNDELAGFAQCDVVPLDVRICPAVPVLPFAVSVVTIALEL
jgi:hypothetical protein